MRIVSVLAATGAGAAVGWVCGLVPVWPVARLAAAVVMGAVVGVASVVVSVLLTLSRSASGGLGAVSFGLSEAVVLAIPVVILLAVAAYALLRWFGSIPAGLAEYGPVILGGGAALLTALWLARGMAVASAN